MSVTDAALQPPHVIMNPGDAWHSRHRRFQGIPGIERCRTGRLWATWYTGGDGEGPDNHVVLTTSTDDGGTWSDPPLLVIAPEGEVRAFDPCLWRDPYERLWLFWAQSEGWCDGRCGVWCMRAQDGSVPMPRWTAPRRLANGIMMNKPTVLKPCSWLLPIAVWKFAGPQLPEMDEERASSVYATSDGGETFTRMGGADIPDRQFDEHMTIVRRDHSLWLLARSRGGIGQSLSYNGGVTWTPGTASGITGPGSRFHIRRLASGALLLLNHHGFTGRSHLTALLSDDEGKTWAHRLLLDERREVSYPDATEGHDGKLYVIYDYNRTADKEILMAVITEADIRAGKLVTPDSRLRQLVNRAGAA